MTAEPSSTAARAEHAGAFGAQQLLPYVGALTFLAFLCWHLTYASPELPDGMAPALERGAHIPWLFWILGFLLLLGVAFQLVAEFTPLFQRALAPSPSALTPGMRLAKRTWRLLAVAFIGYQVASTWWPVATGELYLEDLNGKLGAELSSVSSHGVPLIALGYLLGLAGVSYQLIESLDGVWAQLRLARAPRLRRVAPTFGRILGVGVFAVTANSVVHFATGASALSHLLTAW